jgi:group II intron reverse transcriptase/maturase
MRRIKGEETKSLPITKQMVWEAYHKVKSNRGGAGVDKVSLEMFQADLGNNLYKLWNRLSSGSYFPPEVREVLIPKSNGKVRKLGIPTVSDRIAQQVLKSYLEPRLEQEFHKNSYGYRPQKSAHQAVEAVRKNVRNYDWVIDMDIKSFFDEVDHELLMKALDRHVEEKWIKMYVRRWLEAPKRDVDGRLVIREGQGTPQGGVISPLLANLYLHYTLDKWLKIRYSIPFVRYADDLIIHCEYEVEAKEILAAIRNRLQECGLRLNEAKTKIVYCHDYRRKEKHSNKSFDFLGFRFQPRSCKSKEGRMFLGFDCAISPVAKKRIAEKWKTMNIHRWTPTDLHGIAREVNPILRGIYQYYGKFRPWELESVFRVFHFRLVKWVLNKYKRFGKSYNKGYQWLRKVRSSFPYIFYHWQQGVKTM